MPSSEKRQMLSWLILASYDRLAHFSMSFFSSLFFPSTFSNDIHFYFDLFTLFSPLNKKYAECKQQREKNTHENKSSYLFECNGILWKVNAYEIQLIRGHLSSFWVILSLSVCVCCRQFNRVKVILYHFFLRFFNMKTFTASRKPQQTLLIYVSLTPKTYTFIAVHCLIFCRYFISDS